MFTKAKHSYVLRVLVLSKSLNGRSQPFYFSMVVYVFLDLCPSTSFMQYLPYPGCSIIYENMTKEHLVKSDVNALISMPYLYTYRLAYLLHSCVH